MISDPISALAIHNELQKKPFQTSKRGCLAKHNANRLSLRVKLSKGFSLIEILLVSVLIMVSVTGVITLQSQYMRADQELAIRHQALLLANQKMEDLQQFASLRSYQELPAYSQIKTNLGGHLAAGELIIAMDQQEQNQLTFERNWKVTDLYWSQQDNGQQVRDLVTSEHANAPNPLPDIAPQKRVEVVISWQDLAGQTQQIWLTRQLLPLHQSDHDLFNSIRPAIALETQLNAEFVQTTDVFQQSALKQTMIIAEPPFASDYPEATTFTAVKLSNDPERLTLTTQEDLLSQPCRCILATNAQGKTPATQILREGALTTVAGKFIEKPTGVAAEGQPKLCDTCCRDHHDTQDMVTNQMYYKRDKDQAHQHYVRTDTQNLQVAEQGDEYSEVCLMKRIDGVFQVIPDWLLIDLAIYPESNDKSTWQLEQSLDSYIQQNTLTETKTPTIQLKQSTEQLVAKGLYIEPLNDNLKNAITKLGKSRDSNWKSLLPYFIIDLTQSATWQSEKPQVLKISNESVVSQIDLATHQFGQYSRGRASIAKYGSAQLTVAIPMDHIASQPLDESVDTGKQDFSVRLTADFEHQKLLFGQVHCLLKNQREYRLCRLNNKLHPDYIDLRQMTISTDNPGSLCEIYIPQNNNTPFYSCARGAPAKLNIQIPELKNAYSAQVIGSATQGKADKDLLIIISK